MSLVIVESPNKMPKLRKILGANYTVMATVGHIMDLKKKDGFNKDTYEPNYEVSQGKKDVANSLKAAASSHDEIYIASDADREGEAIAFNVLEILGWKGEYNKDGSAKLGKRKAYRAIFKEITKSEVLAGIANPIGFNQQTFNSQRARRVIDRIVGFQVSPVMWMKGLKGTSAGRVQSAGLKFLTDREKEIRAFKPNDFWTVETNTDKLFSAKVDSWDKNKEILSQADADSVVKRLGKELVVTKYVKKTRTRDPDPPFTTSTMQQDAAARFGWTGQKVMDTAQSLFSQGGISYHRSDSVRISLEKLEDIRVKIENEHGLSYLPTTANIYSSGGEAQDAHEAIRPTFEPLGTLSSDEQKLLDLITNRFYASQMNPAKFDQASMELTPSTDKDVVLKASGSILQFDGFLKVYGSSTKDVMIPALVKGDKVKVVKPAATKHTTKPPGRYTDSSFTAKLEKEGVGRPSTFVSTVNTLLHHSYLTREKQALKPTEIGMMVSDYLNAYFSNVTNAAFTAKMESELDLIAHGKEELKTSVDNFLKVLNADIEYAKKETSHNLFKSDIKCEKCEGFMVKKLGKNGPFYGCEKYPECGSILSIKEDGSTEASEVETGMACPVCSSKVEKKKGKFGFFFGCSSYPTCTWISKATKDGEIKVEVILEEKCPDCSSDLKVRQGKFGEFVSCSTYPKCKFSAKQKDGQLVVGKKKEASPVTIVAGMKCPKCKSPMAERKGKFGTFISCTGYPKCKYIHKEPKE